MVIVLESLWRKMARSISRGFYLVMEGPEGCGKTTQYHLLADRLGEEFDVVRIREPGGTPIGKKIREILLDSRHDSLDALTELFLFAADRRHLIRNVVIPSLNDGKLVMSDRCFYSTEAYQGAGGKLDLGNIRKMNELATDGTYIDLAIILDIDSKLGLERARDASNIEDKIEARTLDYHQKVRTAYQDIAERDSDVCVLVDASRDIDEIHDEVYRIAKERIKSVYKSS